MKQIVSLFLVLTICLPALAGCGTPAATGPVPFDDLAWRVPGDADQAFFLNLKLEGQAGQNWRRIRRQVVENPAGEEILNSLLSEFKIEEYGLLPYLVGPVVNGFRDTASYIIAQVSDGQGAADALRRRFRDTTWEETTFEGKSLYAGQVENTWGQREWLAWALDGEFLVLVRQPNAGGPARLQALLGLAEGDSLAALPAWLALQGRLAANPLGLIFFNVAGQASRNPPAPGDESPGAILAQQIEAIALAAVPETEGMRVEMAGIWVEGAGSAPQMQPLFALPTVTPATWDGLPADTALALIGHDASLVWPWLQDMLSIDTSAPSWPGHGLGLADLETELFGSGGPLRGDFGMAVTPPLPEQPIVEGLTALQLLFLAPGASEAQMAGVRAALESQGAVFGPAEVEGVALHSQVGTAPSGYALTYGLDGDTLLIGSSPQAVGQGVAARRHRQGLVRTRTFERVAQALPEEPNLVFYLAGPQFAQVAQANMSTEQYQGRQEYQLLAVFEAIGLGLRLEPEGLEGVLFFAMQE